MGQRWGGVGWCGRPGSPLLQIASASSTLVRKSSTTAAARAPSLFSGLVAAESFAAMVAMRPSAVSRAAWAFSTLSLAHSTNVRFRARLADTVAVVSASGGASGSEASGGSAAAAAASASSPSMSMYWLWFSRCREAGPASAKIAIL